MSEIFVVITVARQVEGDYIFIKTEKAFRHASKADAMLQSLKKDFCDEYGKVKIVKVSTPSGEAECFCEVGAFTIELEEEK